VILAKLSLLGIQVGLNGFTDESAFTIALGLALAASFAVNELLGLYKGHLEVASDCWVFLLGDDDVIPEFLQEYLRM
jgi:hypothetical protein